MTPARERCSEAVYRTSPPPAPPGEHCEAARSVGLPSHPTSPREKQARGWFERASDPLCTIPLHRLPHIPQTESQNLSQCKAARSREPWRRQRAARGGWVRDQIGVGTVAPPWFIGLSVGGSRSQTKDHGLGTVQRCSGVRARPSLFFLLFFPPLS